MALSSKLLSKDETEILHMHEHIKRLIPNFALSALLIAAAIAGFVFLPAGWRTASTVAILVLLLAGLLVGMFWPSRKWVTATYTITNRRSSTRAGIFTKTGHDIPLSRISNVAYEHDLIDRLFGAGTLELQTSADDPLYLTDVPNAERVHVMLTNLLFNGDARPGEADEAPAGARQ